MKIIFVIRHPARVHLHKNTISELSKDHDVYVFAHDKELVSRLLESYNIDYTLLTTHPNTQIELLLNQIKLEYNLLKHAKKIEPDVIIGGPSAGHVSKIVGARSISFWDSEGIRKPYFIHIPFTDVILSPESYKVDLGSKHIKYSGNHELAYLHPNRFSPDSSILKKFNIHNDQKIIILRFIAWKALHDIDQSGFTINQKKELVSRLTDYGQVYITSESKLPSEFEDYRLPVPPHRIHDLLYYADLYVGDSQTMASEAAVLGTPAIRSNSFSGENNLGYLLELEEKYDLLYSTTNPEKAINKAVKWIQNPNLKDEWQRKRQKFLEDKIDVTNFIIDVILGKND